MEELKRFQGSRKFVEDQDTILELTGKIQELQNEINCMNDSRDFQGTDSVCSGHSHVASQLVSFPPHPVPGEMLAVLQECRAAKMGRQAFGTHMVCRETFFANPAASSAAPFPQELIHGVQAYQNRFTHQRQRRI